MLFCMGLGASASCIQAWRLSGAGEGPFGRGIFMADNKPEALSKDQLKRVAGTIIAAQGNKYVKELLRQHNIQIGLKKDDFIRNMIAAIDQDRLTQPMIEQWLAEVEGWGRQHVYLYALPAIAPADLRTRLEASAHAELLATPISYDFPPQLQLTSIALSDKHLSLLWHVGDTGWERAKNKDIPRREEQGDFYKYDAFRERADRTVVRFEWRFGDPYSAILVQLPHKEGLHEGAIATVFDDLATIGIIVAPLKLVRLTKAVKASSTDKKVVVQSTRMGAQDCYVELATTSDGVGIEDVEAVRESRKAVNDKLFSSAEGLFGFIAKAHPTVSMPVKAQVSGSEGRIKIWAQCTRDDVYVVTDYFWSKN